MLSTKTTGLSSSVKEGHGSMVKGQRNQSRPQPLGRDVYNRLPPKLAKQYIIVEIYRNIHCTDTMSVCDTNKCITSEPTNDVVSQGSFKPLFQGDYLMT